MKKYVCGMLIMLLSNVVNAQEVSHSFFKCDLAENNLENKIVFNSSSIDDGRENYVVWDVYGSLATNNPDAYGDYGDVKQRLFSTERITREENFGFNREGFNNDTGGYNYVMFAIFRDGSEVYINFDHARDQNGEDAYVMYIDHDNSRGPEYGYIAQNLDRVLNESELYNVGDGVVCKTDYDLRDFETN